MSNVIQIKRKLKLPIKLLVRTFHRTSTFDESKMEYLQLSVLIKPTEYVIHRYHTLNFKDTGKAISYKNEMTSVPKDEVQATIEAYIKTFESHYFVITFADDSYLEQL